MPLKKPRDTGYPKCPDCASAGLPAGAPLLKVYISGPSGPVFLSIDRLCTAPKRQGATASLSACPLPAHPQGNFLSSRRCRHRAQKTGYQYPSADYLEHLQG